MIALSQFSFITHSAHPAAYISHLIDITFCLSSPEKFKSWLVLPYPQSHLLTGLAISVSPNLS